MALLQEIQVPLLAVNDTTLTVVEISRPGGSRVSKGDVLMVFETSKTTYDVEATEDGYVQYLCEADRDYEVNTVVAKIFSEEAEAAAAVPKAGRPVLAGAEGASAAGAERQVLVAPAGGVRQVVEVRQNGQEVWNWAGETLFSNEALRLIESAGIGRVVFAGRDFVTAGDVRAFMKPAEAPRSAAGGQGEAAAGGRGGTVVGGNGAVPAAKAILPADPAKVILERLSSGKKREIDYLSDVQSSGLTSTLHTFVATDGIFTHINKSLKYLKDSLLPVIIYEVSRLLADYPLLNAYYTGEAIAKYKEVNTGFAIDIDKGLKVLKIGGAGQKHIGEIEQEILRLSGSYLDDSLTVEDLTDISFTITDLSSEGVSFFRPLINKMNSAILGVSAIDGQLQRFALSLTFDHRVTEGKAGAQFLRELKERLESYRATDIAAAQSISCFKCYKTLREDLGGTGFARVVTPEGKDGYICQSCLKGF